MLNYLSYLPEFLSNFEEFKQLGNTNDEEIKVIWDLVQELFSDQFIKEASEQGIKRWESILRIVPKGTDNLEDRKFRVIARLNEKLPYTEETLRQKLAILCGEDGYTLTINYGEYELKVRISLAAKSMYSEAEKFIRRTVPANMIVDIALKYNQHSTISKFTHEALNNYTHDQMRNEVIQ